MTDIPKIAQLSNHLSTSEVVTGLILSGKQTVTGFNPDEFAGEYANVIKDIKQGKTQEELMLKYGNTLIQTAHHAARSVNGLGTELDWREIIGKSYKNETIIDGMQKALRYAERGETEKLGDMLRRLNATYSSAQRMRSVPADEIDSGYTEFMKSGSLAWDKHFGGFPTVGVIILAAKFFTGKTTVAIMLMDKFLQEYPDRDILFVTLEDMNEGFKKRASDLLGNRAKDFWHRVKVMEFANSPDEIIEEAARYDNIGLIITDYIDYLVKGKDVESYDEIYKVFSMGAKSLAVNSKYRSMPIVLLSQFGKSLYKGGVPTDDAIPYAGGDKAYQIMMLYNPNNDNYSDNSENPFVLPAHKGYGYLISWKVKNGCRPHLDEFPGAIKLPWSSKYGFDLSSEGEWFSLAADTKREVKKRK